MERGLPKPIEIGRFVRRQGVRISATVGGGGLISSAFMSGRVDTVVGIVGGLAAAYAAYRVIQRRESDNNEPKDK